MKLVVAVTLFTCLFTSVAQAKPKATKKTGMIQTNYSATSQATAEKRESYRPDGREGEVGVAATAGFLYVGVGGGIDLWYMAGRKLQLGVEINKVSSAIDSRTQGGDTAALNEYLNIDLTGFKAQGRYFVWNSLFVSSGLSFNLVNGEYGFYFGDTDDHSSRKYSASMLMAHVGLGNQWRLKNGLVLGGEWVGAGAHLATSVKDRGDSSEISASSGVTAADDADYDPSEFQKKVSEKLEGQIQFSLAMLTLGYEF